MNDFLCAFRLHIFSEGGEGSVSEKLKHQTLGLIQEISIQYGGQLLEQNADGSTYTFDIVDKAILAAIDLQKKLDANNANSDLRNLCLASIGIAWKINPFTLQKEEIRSKDLASFIAESASAGEIFLSEGVFDSIKSPEALDCKFTQQIILAGEEKPLNIYEVFWNHSEVELGKLHRDPDAIDLDIQPIRSFGLKLVVAIALLFFGVLMLTVGFDPMWAYFMKLVYR